MKRLNHKQLQGTVTVFIVMLVLVSCKTQKLDQVRELEWISPNQYRIAMTISSIQQSEGPSSVDIDFSAQLAEVNATGGFDKHTVEVVAYDASGTPVVFDESRDGYEKYLLPSRVDTYYG